MKAFFIAGVQRSGTTLLSVMLRKHPAVFMEERAVGFRIITGFKNLYDLLPHNLSHNKKEVIAWLVKNDINDRLANLIDYKNIEQYADIRSLISGSIQKKLTEHQKQIWGDKLPNIQHYMNDVTLLVPEAKILHIIRDGRANAYSMSTRSYRHLSLSAQQWVDGNIFGIVNREILGSDKYKLIHYENILLNPEAAAKDICHFLEIPYAPEMINLADEQLSQEKSYVKSFFDQSKIDKWKQHLNTKQIRQIENIQGPLLEKLNYSLVTPKQELHFKLLSLRKQIWYNQLDNVKQLFDGKRKGMKNKELIEYKIPLKNRLYAFFRFLARDLLALPIFKSLFSRFYYTDKFYKND